MKEVKCKSRDVTDSRSKEYNMKHTDVDIKWTRKSPPQRFETEWFVTWEICQYTYFTSQTHFILPTGYHQKVKFRTFGWGKFFEFIAHHCLCAAIFIVDCHFEWAFNAKPKTCTTHFFHFEIVLCISSYLWQRLNYTETRCIEQLRAKVCSSA